MFIRFKSAACIGRHQDMSRMVTLMMLMMVFLSADRPGFQDQVWPGRFLVETATLHNAGFEWKIGGDRNRNAQVLVTFRKLGGKTWSAAQPLLRLGGEKIYGHEQRWHYTVPDMFAGSIFGLVEGTGYECRFELVDPDGLQGEAIKTVYVTTKTEPQPWPHGQVYHVYPPDHQGPKEQPAFTGLNEAYYGGGNTGDWWNVPEARVQPGDVILVHAGLYQGDLLNYVDPLALNFHGAYMLTQKGTPDRPITIKAAGDGEVIFDGAGAYRLFDVMGTDHHLFEGLTIRNTQIAFYGGFKHVKGCRGLTVKNCRLEDVGIGVVTYSEESSDFYIVDNTFIGRHDPDTLHGWYGFKHPAPITSYYAIKVYGRGHVIAHNRIAYFHDGICIDTHGLPDQNEALSCHSVDIYRNDIFNMADDFIETDGGVHNLRVYENRGFNSYHAGLSAQPVFGGPAYFIRNILYQVPGTTLKFTIRPSGLVVYHNTFCTNTAFVSAANSHFRNNLFMSTDTSRPWSGTFLTRYSTSDYNGFSPSQKGFRWRMPAGDSLNNGDEKEFTWQTAENLAAYQQGSGLEKNSRMVDYSIFQEVIPPDPVRKGLVYDTTGVDFRLKPRCAAVDAGERLPNINDVFTGRAPDLGALEVGEPGLHYGPRKRAEK